MNNRKLNETTNFPPTALLKAVAKAHDGKACKSSHDKAKALVRASEEARILSKLENVILTAQTLGNDLYWN